MSDHVAGHWAHIEGHLAAKQQLSFGFFLFDTGLLRYRLDLQTHDAEDDFNDINYDDDDY